MMLGSPLLSAIPGLRHAFFTSEGGVSEGVYTSLNGGPGSNDDPAQFTLPPVLPMFTVPNLPLTLPRMSGTYGVCSQR